MLRKSWFRWWTGSSRTKRQSVKGGARTRSRLHVESLENRYLLAGWTPLAHTAPGSAVGVMLLLSDGTVMAKSNTGGGDGYGNTWYKLTPDANGSYINGTWSTLAPMANTRLYFSSQVLTDGRVYVAGGEYGTGLMQAEVYDPLLNTWTSAPSSGQRFSDANSEILPDGRVLQARVEGTLRLMTIYDPVSNTWVASPSSNGIHNESAWVKLPDNSILMVDRNATTSERYIPALNQWITDATVPVALYDPFGLETGGALLLPDGRAFFIGSLGHTAYYTPSGSTSPGTWAAGPDIPGSQGTPDAAAAMMVNGKIICAVSPVPTSGNHFPSPTAFYEFDYTTNNFTSITAPGGGATLGISSYLTNFLDLPDGNVLYSTQYSSQLYVYTPSGSPVANGKPTINAVSPNGDGSYHLTGTLLNGISEGATYGDDWQMNTNYPIVRLTSGSNVYYARTYNWSSTGVMTGSTVTSTEFKLPSGLPSGSYSLEVVANGIASTSITFNTINQQPTLNSINAMTSLEDVPTTVNLTGIAAGTTDTGQTITITATSDNPLLIPNGNISVNYTSPGATGAIVYTPAANLYGTATITVTVKDNGGTVSGGVDTLVRTFGVTVTDVNDAPSVGADTAATIIEDSAAFNILLSTLLSNDSPGPSDESAQTLSVTGVSNAVGGSASLVGDHVAFTPAANFFGTGSFNYTVTDNGTSNGVADPKSTIGLVTFTVTEINDAPVAVNDTLNSINKNVASRVIPFSTLTANDSRGAANESGQTLTVTSVSNPVGGTVQIVGTDVVFLPTLNYSGPAGFTYSIQDNGTTNGAPDPKSASGSVSFNILDASFEVNFALATSSINEAAPNTTVMLVLSSAAPVDILVPFSVSGTATAGADFSIVNSSVTIPTGQTSALITVSVVNDTRHEANETVVITLGSPPNATLGPNIVHTVTIVDNDPLPQVSFVGVAQSVLESSPPASITVRLSQPSDVDVTIPFTVGGTATAVNDYSVTSSPIVIPAGQTAATISVALVDDAIGETNENVSINLATPTNAVLGTPAAYNLIIIDNDALPAVQFSTAAQTVNESVRYVAATVLLSQAVGTPITVPFTVGGSATSLSDFSIGFNAVTIPAGLTQATITVAIVDDAIEESDETIALTVGTPIGATVGAVGTHTITITDNDPTINFLQPSQVTADENGAFTVVFMASAPVLQGFAPAFNISGTATQNVDYTLSDVKPEFDAGESSIAITITILSDTTVEPTETVILTLQPSPTITLGLVSSFTLFINDDDGVTPATGLDLNGFAPGQDYMTPPGLYVEDTSATTLAPSATVVSPNTQSINSITVTLGSVPDGAAESLSATASTPLSVSTYDSSSRSITISGAGTDAQYQAALRTVSYVDSSQNPTGGSRFAVFRAAFSGGGVDSRRRNFNVQGIDDAPAITLTTSPSTTSYTSNSAAVAIDGALTLSDIDSNRLVQATVTLTNPQPGDLITAPTVAGVTASGTSSYITFTGSNMLSIYQYVLRNVKFSGSVTAPARLIDFQVTDDSGVTSVIATRTLNVQGPQSIAGGELGTAATNEHLTSSELEPIVTEAIARWALAGVTSTQLAVLRSATIEVRDLDGQRALGLGGGNEIILDDNADGWGWYIDTTPSDDSDFPTGTSRVDLLTVVMHEMGHILGLLDSDDPASVMTDELGGGTRRTPDAALAAYYAGLG